jgi:hypothetical protein
MNFNQSRRTAQNQQQEGIQLWGLNAPESIDDVEQVFETLVQNYPILVRGVLQAPTDEQLQLIAQKLIESYPVFVRGVIEACMEDDFDAIEQSFGQDDEEEETTTSSRSNGARSVSGEDRRGEVTDPAHDRRLKQNRSPRYARTGRGGGSRSRSSRASH